MAYRFQMIGEPVLSDFFNLKDKIYYEMVHRLMGFGQRYVPHYFIRGMTGFLFDKYKDIELIGIEIGTSIGANAQVMCCVLPIKYLYCIDPYEVYEQKDVNKKADTRNQYRIAKKMLKKYQDKVVFVKDYSFNAMSRFADNSLDFVYIDGNHDYECVKKDIELYYPKVKIGGVLGGHDFGSGYLGVVFAVLKFVNNNDFKLFTGRDADWWIIKHKVRGKGK